MKKEEFKKEINRIRDSLGTLLEIRGVYYDGQNITILGSPWFPMEAWQEDVSSHLFDLGYEVRFEQNNGQTIMELSRIGKKVKPSIPWINLILFFLTVLSTFAAGALMENIDPFKNPLLIYKGATFAVPLLLILLFHEFGHYIMSRRSRIKVSLPYFIPGPTILGTFGAIIRSKSPFKNRKELLDVGATGPMAGFVISVLALAFGLATSQVVKEMPGQAIILGDSVAFKLISLLVLKNPPEGYDVLLSPMAFAGWAGLLVTMLNLLPIGQLDGGHIAYALFGKKQNLIARIIILGLIPLGVFLWQGWLIWLVLAFIIRPAHPHT
ncbi:MAG: site-2 protease family protein, partial [candidate division Zixibacteria bacterium]|nr:site-2 protease family protein [candidate division Zixibacteria bacterium]